jgi:hypothetical protein
MKKVLNIVNTNRVIEKMKEAKIPGAFLPWQDFLHEGPVPELLSLEALSKIRAEYISQKGLGTFESIHQTFKERDTTLNSFKKYDRVILWFERDLYAQLQLIQILDWFAKYANSSKTLSLIQSNQDFENYTNKELQELLLYNKEHITHNHLIVAKKAWRAFTASTPEAWFGLIEDDTSALPALKDSVIRMLEEYPNSINGLSRTAHQALLIIANDIHYPPHIFEAYQKSEKYRFMGDILFFDTLKKLLNRGLLVSREEGKYLEITSLGEEILRGERNWLDLDKIDFWLGGVHQTANHLWLWDIQSQKPIKAP